MILAKPENRQRLIFFAGIERVRYRRPVHAGDVVEIEATVLRLRSRMGRLQGVARVNGQAVIEGTMTFALGPPQGEADAEPAETAGEPVASRRVLSASHSHSRLCGTNSTDPALAAATPISPSARPA